MKLPERSWDGLEAWLEAAFGDKMRKTGKDPLFTHSVRVGRALRAQGQDPITVFGGYCHDVIEDTIFDEDDLLGIARELLGSENDAQLAVALVIECSYSKAEYALPKKERKAAACARWLASQNPRVAYVKAADVDDNSADAINVSPEFEQEYLSWAWPFRVSLGEIIAARTAAAPVV